MRILMSLVLLFGLMAAPVEVRAEQDDDAGFFSFLNFAKKKREISQPTEPTAPQEDPMVVMTRMADAGDLNSQLSLGYIYLYGEGETKIDYKKAFHYYSLAAEQGDNVAINNLGSLYYSGIGTAKNIEKAVVLFEKAADMGNVEAAVNLAFLYLTGNGTPKNADKAMELFKKAAEKDNPTAQFMLGHAHYVGYHVDWNYAKAFELVQKAANAQYDDAQFMLAIMYTQGHGVPQNYGKAVNMLRKAAIQGNLDALMMLGDILAEGTQFPQDVYAAHIMYNLSSVRGAEGATEKRDEMTKKMPIDKVLAAQAEADAYKEKPSQLTQYIQQTFGANIKDYIDKAKEREEKSKSRVKQAESAKVKPVTEQKQESGGLISSSRSKI